MRYNVNAQEAKMLMNRRGVLGGLASMLAAPAIVHASNLMPVKPMLETPHLPLEPWLIYCSPENYEFFKIHAAMARRR